MSLISISDLLGLSHAWQISELRDQVKWIHPPAHNGACGPSGRVSPDGALCRPQGFTSLKSLRHGSVWVMVNLMIL